MSYAPFIAPGRDDGASPGRPKQSSTVYYVIPGRPIATSSGSGGALTANRDVYSPIWVDSPIVVDQIAAEVITGSAGNLRIGVYAADKNWQPVGPPLADSGDMDSTATGVKSYTPGTPFYLQRGRYLSVWNSSTSSINLRLYTGPTGLFGTSLGATQEFGTMYGSRSYAAFPNPGTAWTSTGAPLYPAIVYRLSAV